MFTIEAAIRIIVYGFYQGEDSYLQNPWNQFDFILISLIWLTYLVFLTGVFDLDENVVRLRRAVFACGQT